MDNNDYREQMQRDIGTPEPTGRFYAMMADPASVLAYIQEHGGARWEEDLKGEVREAMDEHGARVVLWYGERISDVNAVLGEWTI